MTEQLPNCSEYGSAYVYEDRGLFIYLEYGHEWSPAEEVAKEDSVVGGSNGNLLADGDNATVIKDLRAKGAGGTIEQGTEVKNIRLVEGDHSIDCKVDGFGPMKLKSEFVKKN